MMVAFAVAMSVPNIWVPLQVTGAVAAGMIGFIIPSMLHLQNPGATPASKAGAMGLLSMGVLVAMQTTVSVLVKIAR